MLPLPAPVVIVQNEPGGQLSAFIEQLEIYKRRGVFVRIEGPCNSACTIVTAMPADRICVGPAAELGFHRAFVRNDDDLADMNRPSDDATAYMMKLYPKRLRNWIRQNGGLTSSLMVLRGEALRQMFHTCPQSASSG